ASRGPGTAPEIRGIRDIDEDMRLGTTWTCGQVSKRILEGVLFPREPLHEVAADNLAAVLHAQQRVAQRGPVAPGELAADHAVAGQQELRASLLALLGGERLF